MTKHELKNQITEGFGDKYQSFEFAEKGAAISRCEFKNLKKFISNVVDDVWRESKIAERKRIRQALKQMKQEAGVPEIVIEDVIGVVGRKPENRDVDIEKVSVKEIFSDEIKKLGKHDGGREIKQKVNQLIEVVNKLNE
jgi:hypothetical protein